MTPYPVLIVDTTKELTGSESNITLLELVKNLKLKLAVIFSKSLNAKRATMNELK